MTFNFESTKKDILNKKDKSNIGFIDKDILKLCDKINSNSNYFTTSSCSGRIVLVLDGKKRKDIFLFRTHDKINFNELKYKILEISEKFKKELIYFKQEPCLIVVSCKNKESQWKLFSEARNNGWKKSGILSLDKKILVELMSTENISFPIIKNRRILVDDKFLKIVLNKSNKNLEKGWSKIKYLEKKMDYL
ncbi:MAG: hypothetical protein AABW83_01325 [Nanoarchaeota archaeon]